MDTVIILSSLMGLGYFLNKEKQTRNNPHTRDIVDPHEVPNSYNIYQGNMVNVVREHEQGLGNDLFKKSKNAKQTRIIPPLYNLGNPTASGFEMKKKTLVQSTPRGLEKKKMKKRTFANQEDNNPKIADVLNEESGGFNKVIPVERFTETNSSFTHQNMVPFFSGNSTNQNMQMNSDKSILERFTATGSSSLLKPGKKEVDNLFKPEKNPNVFTTNLPNEETRTRYIVSELQTNDLPFEQTRVAPGLNQDYGTKGNDGFHPMYQAPQYTVDDLRVLTNQKTTYNNQITNTKPLVQERAMQTIVKKNQPERTFEKLSFITATPTGSSTQHKLPENFENLPNTTRSQETYDWGSLTKSVKNPIMYDETDLPRVTRKETTTSSYIGTMNQNKGKGYLTTTYLAPTTTKETTTRTNYIGIAEGTAQHMSQQQYHNTEINALKESTLVNRKPTTVKEQLFYGKEDVNQALNKNVRFELQENMTNYPNITNIYSKDLLSSRITQQKDVSKKIDDRIDSIFTDQVRQNPFSHPLA